MLRESNCLSLKGGEKIESTCLKWFWFLDSWHCLLTPAYPQWHVDFLRKMTLQTMGSNGGTLVSDKTEQIFTADTLCGFHLHV